ncbi:MAG: 50S ribosomal protein L21 [Deltaproteobacteria bacterium]|nr:50S ribosomal protein L21 [Deltaproteobacteria bacterium]MBI3016733.1 50S ribosomal protein L21 [Deltaproteobacteria bacterium]
MYAVIQTGSKQYKLQPGDLLTFEKLEGAVGSEVVLSNVLLVQDKELTVGNPYLEKAGVLCEIMAQGRGPKVLTFKYKRRKGSRRIRGHRQTLTLLKVKEISLTGVTAKAPAKEKAPKVAAKSVVAKAAAPKIKKAAPKKTAAKVTKKK